MPDDTARAVEKSCRAIREYFGQPGFHPTLCRSCALIREACPTEELRAQNARLREAGRFAIETATLIARKIDPTSNDAGWILDRLEEIETTLTATEKRDVD